MLRRGNIEELKAVISNKGGLARTNLYFVQLPSLIGGIGEDAYNVGLLCQQVSLPSLNLSSVERTIGVSQQKVVYGYNNPSVSMQFRVLNDHSVRRYFEQWQSSALNRYDDIEGRYEVAYPDEYVKPVTITQLKPGVSFPGIDIDLGIFDVDLDIATKFEKTYQWTLNRAYPLSVQNETFSDAASNEISTISVEFTYENFDTKPAKGGNPLKRLGAAVLGSIAARI